jgi:caffeoyl-CoA O-methyltransferase
MSYFDEPASGCARAGCLADNTRSGRVVDDNATDDDTMAIKAFNDKVAADDRVESYLLPIGDGVTLIRKF